MYYLNYCVDIGWVGVKCTELYKSVLYYICDGLGKDLEWVNKFFSILLRNMKIIVNSI
jgi:hypothetical protein